MDAPSTVETLTTTTNVQMGHDQARQPQAQIAIELLKKTKKNEPKMFPPLMLVDKEAFETVPGSEDAANTRYIMKEFWKSNNSKIIVAKKSGTGAIIGYAVFTVCDTRDPRFGKKWIKMCYLMRIAVRKNNQGQGIGKKLVNYLFSNYREHCLSLDVSTDNINAIEFYKRVGLKIKETYLSEADKVEFAAMETELDQNGNKVPSPYELKLFSQQDQGNTTLVDLDQQNQKPSSTTTVDQNKQKRNKKQKGKIIDNKDDFGKTPNNLKSNKSVSSKNINSLELPKDRLVLADGDDTLTESSPLPKSEKADVTEVDQTKIGDLTEPKKHENTLLSGRDGQDSTDSSLFEHDQSGTMSDLKQKSENTTDNIEGQIQNI